MNRIKFDINHMKFMSLFENLTQAHVRDCIVDEETLVFIVDTGEIAKAIGKNGSNVKRISDALKKKVRIIEYNEDLLQFVKNVVYPNKIAEIEENEGIVTINAADSQSRGMIIGRAAVNLRKYESIIKRYFEIKELKVN